MIKSVAIQGIRGSFHHIVSKNYFGNDIHLLECLSFDRAVDSLINEETDAVIMAIENSIAGSIIPNYALIDNKNLQVIGEYYLDIQHNLMALPGQSLNDIYEVYSHPMALLQCKDFFKKCILLDILIFLCYSQKNRCLITTIIILYIYI